MRLAALGLLAGLLAGCETTGPQTPAAGTPEEARLVSLARDIEKRGDPGTAIALYERAAGMEQSSAVTHVRLGEARLKVRDSDGAIAAFRAALAKSPQDPQALLGLGTAQLGQGDVDGALRHLTGAAPQVNTAPAWNRLGTAYVLGGKPQEARDAFMRARTLDPKNIDIAGNVALAQALAGEHEAAIGAMRAVAQSPLAEARHRRNLIVVLALAGRGDEALKVEAPDVTAKQKSELVAKAKKVAGIADPVARARAVGLMAGA